DARGILDLKNGRGTRAHDARAGATSADENVGAAGDADRAGILAAQHADFPAIGWQGVDRVLDGAELAMAGMAVTNDDRAATPELAERAEARATVDDLAGHFLPHQAPADQGQAPEEPPWADRLRPIEQVPRDDNVRR